MTNTFFKKAVSLLLAVLLVMSVLPAGIFSASAAENTTEFAGGDGTAANPYLIATKEHLDNVRFYASAHFKMIDDIEFSEEDFAEGGQYYRGGKGWEPIGYTTDSFTGVFDGNCHSVKNIFIHDNVKYVGFFGSIVGPDAEVKNLYVLNADITGSTVLDFNNYKYTAGIAGFISNATISGCYFDGEVHGFGAAGIVGKVDPSGTVEYCRTSGNIHGSNMVGGICGYVHSGSTINIKQCRNDAAVYGRDHVGGICGETDSAYIYMQYSFPTVIIQAASPQQAMTLGALLVVYTL